MTFPRSSFVLLLAALAACSSKSSARAVDAAVRVDATESDDAGSDAGEDDAGADAGDDAGSDAGDDDSGFDATGLPSIDAGGPPACAGPSDCTQGGICCLELAAERAPATCVKATACPSGQAELCGLHGTGTCKSGMCQDYECTETMPNHVVTFFACNVPLLPTVSCGVTTPPSADSGTNP